MPNISPKIALMVNEAVERAMPEIIKRVTAACLEDFSSTAFRCPRIHESTQVLLAFLEARVSSAPLTGIPLTEAVAILAKKHGRNFTLAGLESTLNRTRIFHKLAIRRRCVCLRMDRLVERIQLERQANQGSKKRAEVSVSSEDAAVFFRKLAELTYSRRGIV